jgi:hypothetical protein
MKNTRLAVTFLHSSLLIGGIFLSTTPTVAADRKISTPKELIGFSIGDDYHMANYTQLTTMWKKWETESDRLKVVNMGSTGEGRPQLMAIVTSPANLAKLEHYRDISVKLAHAEGLIEAEAAKLAKEGKTVVWVDGGLHASESVNSQQLIETVYRMITSNDEETLRFLDDVILLCPVANPDGVEIVANWYMRNADEKARTFTGLPRLYNKYVGHDNNRDSIMNNMPETINQNRVLFIEWIPQIMYNHHQTGPEGQVIFIPPFRDPFNYNFDPLVPLGVEQLGVTMHMRLVERGMPGSAMRSAAPYSTWWNGGMRTAVYFHNQIGILSEVIGSPTPMVLPLVPAKQLPTGDWPMPAAPQVWHYKQSIEYDVQVNFAALDYASRNRSTLLLNMYRMGKNAIDRGNRDSWTVTPKRIDALYAAANKPKPEAGDDNLGSFLTDHSVPSELYATVLHAPELRDPRGYIIPTDQDDFATAVKFVNVLLKQGVTVQKATADFSVNGKNYSAGSYVVKAAQAFRAEVMDMFEPQDHPNDFAYPGGPPKAPYDITGWTPAVQMGVKFDRIQDGFDGPFAKLSFDLEKPAPAMIAGPANPAGWLISHKVNDAVVLTNRLLKAGCDVYWLKDEQSVNGRGLGTGTVWVPASAKAQPILAEGAKSLGVPVFAVAQKPTGEAMKLKPIRIGLLDLYGGSMPSGWLRWMLEQYEFSFEIVFPAVLDAGNLNANFDVIVLPSDTYSDGSRLSASAAAIERWLQANAGTALSGTGAIQYSPPAETVPEEVRSMLGGLTNKRTVPPLKTFVEQGGTIVAIGSSARIGEALGLPVKDHLVEMVDGKEKPIARAKYYVPGSVLHANFDNKNPLAYGMPAEGFVFFDNNPVFDTRADTATKVNPVVWFSSKTPLFSGWAWGQAYLDGGKIAGEASIGAGKVVLLSFEPTFRGTPHATFKLFFNGLYYGSAKDAPIP